MSNGTGTVDGLWERFREEYRKLDEREEDLKAIMNTAGENLRQVEEARASLAEERSELEKLNVYSLKQQMRRVEQAYRDMESALLRRDDEYENLLLENKKLKKKLSDHESNPVARGRTGEAVNATVIERSGRGGRIFSSSEPFSSSRKARTPTSGSRVQLTKRYPTEQEQEYAGKARGEKDRKASRRQVYDVRKHVKKELNVYRPVTRGSTSPLPAYSVARTMTAGQNLKVVTRTGADKSPSPSFSQGMGMLGQVWDMATDWRYDDAEDEEEQAEEDTESGKNEGGNPSPLNETKFLTTSKSIIRFPLPAASNEESSRRHLSASPIRRIFPNSTFPSDPGLPSPTFWDRIEAEVESPIKKKQEQGPDPESSDSGSRTQPPRFDMEGMEASVEDAEVDEEPTRDKNEGNDEDNGSDYEMDGSEAGSARFL